MYETARHTMLCKYVKEQQGRDEWNDMLLTLTVIPLIPTLSFPFLFVIPTSFFIFEWLSYACLYPFVTGM